MTPAIEANGENRFTRQLKPAGKPAGVRLSQPQVQADDQQDAGLAITHYKKGFTLHICSTFEKAAFMPEI